MHAIVAQSTFRSQNVQNTPGFGALLEDEMSKKCTPLWREAHFHVKMLKTPHARTAFEASDVVLRGRRKGFCIYAKSEQNVRVLQHFQKRYAQRYWSPSVICNGMLDEVLDLDVSRRLSDRERMLSHVQ